ncbi:DUF6691 family protein [Motilimonas pumila]|uniref:YeeE/YedE family protein n=1 Tax=Motilimonas pumila TaxID=2303987 RepID=A0A418YBH5_9GAMM|nr:DUF6691 family protein [Motilimonas pumila]RJG41850.1 YeeE/YedE family protein [Motilimonas pumila]
MVYVVSLIAGLLFGVGMVISGMVLPDKVLAFLDIAGEWDMSLAFVMGGALGVFAPCYWWLIKPRGKAINDQAVNANSNLQVDSRLIIGASLFGIGWGVAGICPGPAFASLSAMNPGLLIFIAFMLVGFLLAPVINRQIK